ncbi:MAG: DUF2993 domain-containing protein [Streptosporangiaceae bacterium]
MWKALVVVAVLLLGGLVAADRIGVNRAENEISRQVAAQYSLSPAPSVSIGGFPFLTQAVSGTYDRIDVGIGAWTEQGVTVQDVRVRLEGLDAPLGDLINGDQSHLRARTATASAVIPYAVILQQATAQGAQGVKNIARSGKDVLLEGSYNVLGRSLDLGVIVSLKPTAAGIVVTPQTVRAGGLIEVPIAVLQKDLTYTIPVTGLPLGSKITSVVPEDGGVRVTGSGSDVPLNGSLKVQ